MAASTPYRRTGCSVISVTSSGSVQASSIATPSRTVRYSGSERPACRMNQTGVPLHLLARGRPARSRLSVTAVVAAAHGRSLAGQPACSHIGAATSRPTVSTWSSGKRRARARARARRRPSSGRRSRACARRALRPEVFCEEMPAPQRIAPHSSALSGRRHRRRRPTSATGRIILLHDPAGNDAWDGTFRCVAYARAEIETDLITDPLLPGVGWTWLVEALDAHGATTPLRPAPSPGSPPTASAAMADEGGTAQIEIRASWTRVDAHRARVTTSRPGASCCAPQPGCPGPDGVTAMPSRRGQRGPGR